MIKNFRKWIGDDKIATVIVFTISVAALILIVPSPRWAPLGWAALAMVLALGVPWLRKKKEEDLLAVTAAEYDNILTSEQAAGARRYAAKWRRVFFSPSPAKREECEKAATRIYQMCGLTVPSFVWLDSPFQAAVALSILCVNGDEEGIQVVAPMFPAMLNNQVYVPGSGAELTLHRAAMAEVSHEINRMILIRALVTSKLQREMRSSPAGMWNAWSDVYAKLMTQAPELFLDPFAMEQEHGEGVIPQAWMRLYEKRVMKHVPSFFDGIGSMVGRHGAPELLEYEIAYKWRKSELGIKYDQPLGMDEIADAHCTLAKNLGWWIPLGNVVIFTESPVAIRLDMHGRLSAEGGPAVEYRDGWAVHAVEGTLLPAEWGAEAPERWKLDWLLQSGNQAERRLLMAKMDYERLLREEKNARLIHQEADMRLYMIGRWNEDAEYEYYSSNEPIMLLKVGDPSTGAGYVLRVPPDMNTCEQARRWTLHDETGSVKFIKET